MEKEKIRVEENKTNSSVKRSRMHVFSFSLLLSASIFVSSPRILNADYNAGEVCPKGSRWFAFSLQPGEVCRGEKFGNLCSECRTNDGRVIISSKEEMKNKVESAISTTNPSVGKKFTKNDLNEIKKKLKKWDKQNLEKLIKKLNGNLDEDERTIFRGALEHWPEIKYHAMRLGIDPRIAYLVAVAESRFVQKIGKSGERSPMQIMPGTMALMFNRYGKHDAYIKETIKEGKDWRKSATAQMILALYYLRDGISTVASVDARIEELSAESLLMVYHFYNRGHNNYMVENWWQGDNFATCVSKYLRLYPEVEGFIEKFMQASKHSDLFVSDGLGTGSKMQNKKEDKIVNGKEYSKKNDGKKETVTNPTPKKSSEQKTAERGIKLEGIIKSSSTKSNLKPQTKEIEANKPGANEKNFEDEVEKYKKELERIRKVLDELKKKNEELK